MRRRPRTGLICVFVLAAWTSSAASPPAGSDIVFWTLILDRITAYGRGDVAAYTRLLDASFVHISDLGKRRTRADMPAFVASHGDTHGTYSVVRLTWKIEGTLAVVDAELREHLPDHDGGIMETDIFVWRGDRWFYLHHDETEILQSAKAVPVRATALDEYVGRYRSAAGITDVLSARRGKLFDRMLPDQSDTELTPVGRDAFAIQDDPTLLVFIRNGAGQVIQCLWHLPSGQVVNAPRVVDAAPDSRTP